MRTLLSLLLLGIPHLVFSQTTVRVVDECYQPVSDVMIKGHTFIYISNPQGTVTIGAEDIDQPLTLSHLKRWGLWDTTVHISAEQSLLMLLKGCLEPDVITLHEITVATLDGRSLDPAATASIAKISNMDLNRMAATTLVPAFNMVPGVRLEERAPASYRISIRGSALRSPFGVRNVKVYWNGLPLTEPNGTTALNLIDLGSVDRTEILKGPAASSFGAGTGGVINLATRTEYNPENNLNVRYTAGSYGTHHAQIMASHGTTHSSLEARAQHYRTQGYRDHSAVQRTVGQLSGSWSKGLTRYTSTLLLSHLNYQIPGGLTAEQFAENPRQARPRSASQNSSIFQRRALWGHVIKVGGYQWEAYTSLYGSIGDFENPFILDYKREFNLGTGLRSVAEIYGNQWKVQIGLEQQFAYDDAQNLGNVDGVADTLRFHDEIYTRQGFTFLHGEYQVTPKLTFTGGLSLNYSRYRVNRIYPQPQPFTRQFNPLLAPQLGASLKTTFGTLFYQAAFGFSPPTLDEVRTNEGSLNTNLEAERGFNNELGFRIGRPGDAPRLSLSLFHFALRQTITTYTNADGVVLFRNAGQTQQFGVELSGKERWSGQHWNLQYEYAYTGHFFRFQTYETGGQDYSGNQLTGVAPHSLSQGLYLNLYRHWQINAQHRWSSAIPLTDANTVFADPFHTLSAKLSWRWLGASHIVELFMGVDNALDARYSLGNDLNAFGGRYFQPAPGRTFLLGLTVDLTK